jgi:hypothetical protein
MQHPATIEFYPALCGERERPIVETGALRASLFRYDGRADFALTTGYLDATEAARMEERIAALRGTGEGAA